MFLHQSNETTFYIHTKQLAELLFCVFVFSAFLKVDGVMAIF